jgi:hypothetical protein
MKTPPAADQNAKKIYVPHPMLLNIGGTTKAMMKLFIQFAEAPMEVPLARMEMGKISAMRIQEPGPQL